MKTRMQRLFKVWRWPTTGGALAVLPLAAATALALSTANAQQQAPAAPPGMPDLAKGRPQIKAFAAEEIDRVSGRSGLTDCFWVGTLSTDTFNILIPDTGVVYWISQFRMPPGARLSLQGEYPYGRYLSFNAYNATGLPVDRINDQMIEPDAGSTNPFLPGAPRLGTQRKYSVAIEPRALQAGTRVDDASRPRNTLFVPTDAAVYQVWMRVYVPDNGRDVKGGVPLPRPILTLADGRRLEGEAVCREIVVKEGAVRDYVASAEGVRHIFAVPGAKSPYHPAHNPASWNAFFNPQHSVTNVLINTPYEGVREKVDTTRRGGFYSTLDNVYMSTYVDNRYGDALVLRGRAPKTPRTRAGAVVMEPADLRYWSVCKYRSLADGAVDSCLYDELVPLDASGQYTIVISTPEARPSNARPECGVAWMSWGAGDGIGNPHGGFLAFRHMMPAPHFKQSLFETSKPGDEARILGPYYPVPTYESRAQFEARGCPAS